MPEVYKRGDRVVLTRTTDPHTLLEPGTMGTVEHVDDLGTLHVLWDDGARLGLVPGVDVWRPIHPRWEVRETCILCGRELVPGCCVTVGGEDQQ